MKHDVFIRSVQSYYRRHGRHDLPWRLSDDPYAILVSEIMLQQTQVPRVIEKFHEFLTTFPTFRELAGAPVSHVLKVWQGLGYNRRALNLHACATAVTRDFGGALPSSYESLKKLPGIGAYTAGAILAFAFDTPHAVIETNIRRVYIHHFFPRARNVTDARILPLVQRHLDTVRSPRRWYSALMDYGTFLASEVPNPNRRSRAHVKQAAFEGSLRQVRGLILKHLTEHGSLPHGTLAGFISDSRFGKALAALEREGFIQVAETLVHLAS